MKTLGKSFGHPHVSETDTGADFAAYHLSDKPLTKAHKKQLDREVNRQDN